MKRHLSLSLVALIPAALILQGCATSHAQHRNGHECIERNVDDRVRKLDDFDCTIEDKRRDKAPELDDLPAR